ncbi:MAG TPA: transcriptional regulator NrdR [Alphaproteobacteria bacterium]|nr:transcriptional repressor NrdR [Alphaproteobacteria bacterium]HCS22605.1 transcriptional regulator NrdR [Rhodospirillaceae bacterium]HRI76110.1 transcriptional regulator NrdR [Alphaproteobacteria bacterium]HRJ65553.1 transcriptional regulator NrdR [Alphaproteobacteria bacterium]
MKCPFCASEETQVKDSRPTEDSAAIRRRRECPKCEARFTTFERVQLRELVVLKADGRREAFDREKLLRSLRLSLQKRPVESDAIERAANDIVRQLEQMGDSDVPTKLIGEKAMQTLSGLDPIAYVRYASVYKDFREVRDYSDFLADLENVCKKAGAA